MVLCYSSQILIKTVTLYVNIKDFFWFLSFGKSIQLKNHDNNSEFCFAFI